MLAIVAFFMFLMALVEPDILTPTKFMLLGLMFLSLHMVLSIGGWSIPLGRRNNG